MHLDRRKSDVDRFEHVIGGVQAERIFSSSDDRALPRSLRDARTAGESIERGVIDVG
jgi:hypothetical protein